MGGVVNVDYQRAKALKVEEVKREKCTVHTTLKSI